MTQEKQLRDILDNVKVYRGVERIGGFTLDVDKALKLMEGIGRKRADKFRIDDQNRWAYTQLLKWLFGDPTMQAVEPSSLQHGKPQFIPGRLDAGIYIAGTTGTGKSWAMELLLEVSRTFQTMIRLGGQEMRLHYHCLRAEDIWEAAGTEDGPLREYKNKPLLCIQDLGSEPVSDAVRMGTRREPIRQILEARGDRDNLITMITSNFGIEAPEIEKRYTNRVVSRLKGMCNLLVMNGTDRRTI